MGNWLKGEHMTPVLVPWAAANAALYVYTFFG